MSFNDAALSYDRFRPRYPSALFDDLSAARGIGTHSRILEVGCGPGVATEEMMARGWSVLAVDPGERLARVASAKFDDAHFAVEVATFDEWESHGRRFDLVFSATAFHWVAPAVRWVKAAEVLDGHGAIALTCNKAMAGGSFHQFAEATSDVRRDYGVVDERESPSVEDLDGLIATSRHDVGALWEALSPQGSSVIAGELFDAPDVRLYPWTTTYSTVEALGLMATYSRYLVMDPATRRTLFEQLAGLIDRDFAGALTRHYVTVLAVAPRAAK